MFLFVPAGSLELAASHPGHADSGVDRTSLDVQVQADLDASSSEPRIPLESPTLT